MDEETIRFIAIRKIKLDYLYQLDRQAASFGPLNVPPHIEMERGSLREELGMMEAAIASPARSEVTDQLGPAGRFLVNHQQNREIKQSIAALAVDAENWRMIQRNWIILIGLIVILILVAVVALVTFLITKGAL